MNVSSITSVEGELIVGLLCDLAQDRDFVQHVLVDLYHRTVRACLCGQIAGLKMLTMLSWGGTSTRV